MYIRNRKCYESVGKGAFELGLEKWIGFSFAGMEVGGDSPGT